MTTTTTVRSWSAMRARLSAWITWPARGHPGVIARLIYLVLGAFFAALTARVLLWEVNGIGDLSTDHLLSIGAIVGAIAAGVFVWHTLWAGKLLTAAGLGFAFLVATRYCLIGSAGRSDELAFEHNAAARQINKNRDRAQRNRDEAKRRYDTALEAETSECAGGAGTKCLSKRATTRERRSDLEVAELLLQQAKPEQRENGKLKRAAQVIALFTSATEEAAERGLAIVWPFLPPFICELLTIAFLHLGFGHRRVRSVRPSATVQSAKLNRETDLTERCGGSAAKDAAERDLVTYIALHGQIPSQDFLRERWGVRSKGTVSHWLAEWEAKGLIVRVRDGKFKMTKLAN